MVFQAVWNGCQSYYNEIPADTLQQVGKSALYTFTASLIVTNALLQKHVDEQSLNFTRPLMAASVAALASLIHALTTPIFNYLLGNNEVKFYRECIKYFFNASCTYAVMNHLTPFKTQAFAVNVFQLLSLNLLKSYIDLVPICVNWIGTTFHDADIVEGANQVRAFYTYLGWQVDRNSNSVYLMC